MILITGATGFIGSALCSNLLENKIDFKPVIRNKNIFLENSIVVGDIDGDTNWDLYELDMDVVVHAAARVHVMQDNSSNPQAEFDKINLHGTLNLAKYCIKKKVKRFIFISSIKVNGELTLDGPFNKNDKPSPKDPYGLSKYRAEVELKKLCESSEMDLIIIRPPLVYGPKVKGNFSLLVKAINSRVPFPFKNITNKRSLVSVYNLVDFIMSCINHPLSLNDTFLISDDEDVSISDLIKKIGNALDRRVFLFPFPSNLLNKIFKFLKREDQLDRLIGDLSVDIDFTKKTLNWEPRYTVTDSLKKMFSDNP